MEMRGSQIPFASNKRVTRMRVGEPNGCIRVVSSPIYFFVSILLSLFCIGSNAFALGTQGQKSNRLQQTPVGNPSRFPQEAASKLKPPIRLISQDQKSAFDGNRSFGYLADICKIGPRPSASKGMAKQKKYIQAHFEAIGGQFFQQEFIAKSPYSGKNVKLHNLLIRWHPERTRRILICCHHDTRPFADADKRNPRAKFIGANDGGSGVALLCELGHHMESLNGEFGVDFLFFDGEEFVIQRPRDRMFLGSTFFAEQYSRGVPNWRYECAVLVDMVADKDLQLPLEGNSLHFARGLTEEIWDVAREIGVREFVPEEFKFIRDDHLPLNEIAKIPTCDIIDFNFPNPTAGNIYWHTREDKLENCSAESLGKVGAVVLAWLQKKQRTAK